MFVKGNSILYLLRMGIFKAGISSEVLKLSTEECELTPPPTQGSTLPRTSNLRLCSKVIS